MVTVVAKETDRGLWKARNSAYPKQVLYLIASFIAFISLCHFFSIFYTFITRKRVFEWKKRTSVSLTRLPAAAADSFRTLAFRWTVPVGSSHELNFVEVGLTLAYMAVLVTWTFANSMIDSFPSALNSNSHLNLATTLTGLQVNPRYYANRAGRIAASQLPLVVALGMKNNLISCEFESFFDLYTI
jgi:hypothetical protein